jgi:peroxiredoxin
VNTTWPEPLAPGRPAPDFTLDAVHEARTVSLADYRGRSPLFLAIMIGLWCPFCRRHIAQLGGTTEKLRAVGVETLGVVATEVDNARLYFKYRPTRLPLVADPELVTHRAYGLPRPVIDDAAMQVLQTVQINPGGELPAPVPLMEAGPLLNQRDNFQPTSTDVRDVERQWPMLKGQFLVDREGIVRWANIECADGLTSLGKFPTDDEILGAVRRCGVN